MTKNTETVSTPAIDLNAQPDASWSMDRLAAYAKAGFAQTEIHEAEGDRLEKLLKISRRTSVIAFFRAGFALSIAKQEQKANGTWVKWQEAHGLNGTTVLAAIAIFEGAKTEEMVSRFTLEEAKKAWVRNYGKKRPAKNETQPTPAKPLTFTESLDAAARTLAGVLQADIPAAEVDIVQAKLFAIMQQVQTLQTRCAKMQLQSGNREMAAQLQRTEQLIAA